MQRLRTAVLTAGLLALTSCDSGGPSFVPFMLFSYSGAITGTFDAKGAPPNDDSEKPFAAGVRDTESNYVLVFAQVVLSGGGTDLAIMAFPISANGSLNLDPNCDPDSVTPCTGFALLKEVAGGNSLICELSSGSIVITTNTATRAAGTFSGTGTCADLSGTSPANVTFTGGSFEVSIITQTGGV